MKTRKEIIHEMEKLKKAKDHLWNTHNGPATIMKIDAMLKTLEWVLYGSELG